jgi:hypothetical protein
MTHYCPSCFYPLDLRGSVILDNGHPVYCCPGCLQQLAVDDRGAIVADVTTEPQVTEIT